jgi:hypothetical protein
MCCPGFRNYDYDVVLELPKFPNGELSSLSVIKFVSYLLYMVSYHVVIFTTKTHKSPTLVQETLFTLGKKTSHCKEVLLELEYNKIYMSLPIRMNVYILWKICHGS